MTIEYQSGTYCNEIRCEHVGVLMSLGGEEYFSEKQRLCGNCTAWNFFTWLKSKNFAITRNITPETPRAGFKDLKAEDYTEEELIRLRSFYM